MNTLRLIFQTYLHIFVLLRKYEPNKYTIVSLLVRWTPYSCNYSKDTIINTFSNIFRHIINKHKFL